MPDHEDPFLDSPASVSGETTMTTSDAAVAAKGNHSDGVTAASRRSATTVDVAEDDNHSRNNGCSNSDRGDYTAIVRNKYFENHSSSSNNGNSTNHNSSMEEEASKGSMNMDLSEIFDTYEVTPSTTPTSTTFQSGTRGGQTNVCSEEPNDDLWTQQQRQSHEAGQGEGAMRRSFTPPLTLYSSSNNGTPTTPNKNLFTTESAGVMSPVTNDTLMMDAASSGRNTPTSHVTTDAVSGSLASSSTSSVLRSGSVNPPSSLLAKQPVLYSAIGSLEQINTNSLRTLNKRLLAPSREFSKPGAQSLLIPPSNQWGQKQQRTSMLSAVSNTDLLATKRSPTAGNTGNTPGPEMETTARTNNISTTRKVSGEGVFGVLKKHSFNKDDKSIPNPPDQQPPTKPSNLRSTGNNNSAIKGRNKNNKRVSYDANVKTKKKNPKGPIEMFRPSSDAYTPRIERKRIQYKAAEARTPVQQMASPMGTLQRPNFRDALRRVAMIIHQHVVKIENRFEGQSDTKLATDEGLFKASMRDLFNEDSYRTATYKCTMVRIPMARPGMTYGLRKIKVMYEIPSETEIYEFGHQLFKSVQLSSECSIVCLIYVERLMEVAKVPLLACTWRPIFMCGLLLASKVWQDLSSWNIEFASVYPQFSLEAINRLELNFLRNVKWDLYISSSLYAKYYFALRSLVEKQDFRQRYNRMVGGVDTVAQSEALKVQKRTEQVKEEALLQLSRSM